MNYIRLTFQQEGFHRWADCPIPEVWFLKEWHRHVFHFDVKMEVFSSDREVEFIILKRELATWAEGFLWGPVEYSCEKIANELLDYLFDAYGKERQYAVEVMEDGENGGGVIWKP